MKRVPVTLNDLYEGCLLVPKFLNRSAVPALLPPECYKQGKKYKFITLHKRCKILSTIKLDLGVPIVYIENITKDVGKRPYQNNMHVVMQNFQMFVLDMASLQRTWDVAIEEEIDEEDCV